MAENLPRTIEDELMCHICTEIYKDPVQLPCQHSFCRECLKAYVNFDSANDSNTKHDDKWVGEKVKTDAGINIATSEGGAVCCPICRTPVDLDSEGVSKLPIHFTIANIVEKYTTGLQEEADAVPKCSMCEGDRPNTAVKGCVKCGCLYCQDCLSAYHPMRGPLSKHSLVEPENYVSTSMCEEHEEPLKMYCTDCQKLLCLVCSMEEHSRDTLQNSKSAYKAEKDKLAAKTSQLEKVYDDIKLYTVELSKTEEDIRECFDKDFQRIDMKYQTILTALEGWKSNATDAIETKKDSLLEKTKKEMSKLQLWSTEVANGLTDSRKCLEIEDAVSFLVLQTTTETIKSIGMHIRGAEETLELVKSQHDAIRTDQYKRPISETELSLLQKMKDGSTVFKIGEHNILCPEFSMLEEMFDCVSVRDNDKKLVSLWQCDDDNCFDGARASLSFQHGRVYWEIEVSVAVKMKLGRGKPVYSSGVTPQSNLLTNSSVGDGHCWVLNIEQQFPYYYSCRHNCKTIYAGNVHPVQGTSDTVVHGFYLDCIARTLTILDCTYDRVIHIFHNVDLSEPITPFVAVYNYKWVDVSARLRTGQSITTPPTCLSEMLQKL